MYDWNGTFEIFSQSLTTCDLTDIPAASQYDACGVGRVIPGKRDETRRLASFSVSWKVVRSCVFRIRTWSEERQQNITKTIYVHGVEDQYDPLDGGDTSSVVFVTSDGGRDSAEKNAGEKITVQCRFPICGWEMIALCKQGITPDCVRLRRENSTYITFSSMFLASDISFIEVTKFTFALEMRFDTLVSSHAGFYKCGELQATSYSQAEYSQNEEQTFYNVYHRMHFVNFRLTVTEPKAPYVAPYFMDRQSTYQYSIMDGGETILYCPFVGSPGPLIIWSKHRKYLDENGTDIVELIEIREYTNKTSVTVRDIGTYECLAKNRLGENSRNFSVKVHETVASPPSSPIPVALPATALAVLVSFAIAFGILQRRRANKTLFKQLAQLLSEPTGGVELDDVLPLNDQADILPYNTNYEIERDRVQLIKVIGDGEFGQVYRGEFQTNESQRRYVAVKVPKNPLKPEHHQALISELKIMIYLRPHVNVLALIGACTNELEHRQQLFVLTEYCEKGSLLSYLQDHILDYESQAPSFGIQSLLDFAYQAANGMKHLATWKIIHRDLAVRNMLLTHRGVIKIADFGLSRQKETVYSYNKFLFRNVRLPVAWMAPESVTRYEYTHKSDVWSFGIVLWEIFSCGRVPYSNEDICGMEVITWLREGNRLPMPVLVTDEMYSLMINCWASDPTCRPTFSQCKGRIARHLEDKFPSSYTSLLLLLSDSFCQMGALRHASSTALSQEASISTSVDQHEESVSIEMESDFLNSLSDDTRAVSGPASFQYVGSAETSEAGGESNLAFEAEEAENGYVTSGDSVLSADAVFDQELPDDTPLLG